MTARFKKDFLWGGATAANQLEACFRPRWKRLICRRCNAWWQTTFCNHRKRRI